MSKSFASGRGTNKTTCLRCKRTVYVVLDGGQKLATDPELIAVVVKGEKARRLAHRVHAELCERYRHEDERKAWQLAQRKATTPAPQMPPQAARPFAPDPVAPVNRRSLLAHYAQVERLKRREITGRMRVA